MQGSTKPRKGFLDQLRAFRRSFGFARNCRALLNSIQSRAAVCLVALVLPQLLTVDDEQYKQLRNEALNDAELRLSPLFKNPRVSDRGLNPAVIKTLELQRSYQKPSSSHRCVGARIRSVNGNRTGGVFTPESSGNNYRIEGCSFGSLRGHVQLEPHSQAAGHFTTPITLRMDDTASAWTDDEINAHLDPHLSGLSDFPVTLAVYTADGRRLELPGCLFIAARGEPQLLNVVPASWVKLDAAVAHSGSIAQLEYVSPPSRDAAGVSAVVVRFDSEPFGPNSDAYDFSHLNPGWVVDSVQLQTYSILCPPIVSVGWSFGHWDLTWKRRGFSIAWGGDTCNSYAMPFSNLSLSFSKYAARVWVIGPAGTQPLPGVAR